MAQRRALREVIRRFRAAVFNQAAFDSCASRTAGRSRSAWSFLGDLASVSPEVQQPKGFSTAAWLLAAGGAAALSGLTVNAGSLLSVEAPHEGASGADTGKPSATLSKKARVIFVLGGPGSGKGTQCAKIVDEFGFTHLSAGDLLRAEIKSGSEYGSMIQTMIKEGKIVPAEVTVNLLKKAMAESGNDKFLIDGFPRNAENREVFERDAGISPEFVLFFDCPQDVMEKRLLGRNQGRIDDNIDTIRKRFRVFLEQSLPVVEHYGEQGKVHKVDATKSPDEVFKSYSKFFIRFIQDELLGRTEQLLRAIDCCDYAAYARLCDPGLTCFEPEAQGHLVEGLPFHEFYFQKEQAEKAAQAPERRGWQSTIVSPRVTVVGDVGIVTYTRLLQEAGSQKVGSTDAANETRIWQRKVDEGGKKGWKHIHLHRSAAPTV